MNNRTKFYCWLIGKLERRRMTLQEIVDEWEVAASNADHTELSQRTFHRYRDEIDSIFGIEIKCDKTNGYRYYIWRDKYGGTDVTEWMLSALRIASLGDMLKYHNKVMLEEAPMNSHYLDDILEAIDKRYILRIHYRTGYGVEKDMTMLPAFVRLFHQRWYVIGNLWDETKSDSLQVFTPRTLPFNRIETMDIACKKRQLPPAIKNRLTPDSFFEGCFGIMRQEEIPVRKIVVRAFYPENNYITEVPLHESQTKLKDGNNGGYTDFSIRVRPTRDFMQELLWHGRKLAILEPEDFRQEMVGILKDMVTSYETGKDMLEE